MHPCLSQLMDELWFQKTVGKKIFSYETKVSMPSILIRRMCLWYLIMKEKEVVTWIHGCPNRWTNINSKNGRKRCLSYEAEAWIPINPMRRMCLWCLMTKRMEIVMWIRVCPNRWTDINSKNGRKRSFSYKTKASISFFIIRRMHLWFLIIK